MILAAQMFKAIFHIRQIYMQRGNFLIFVEISQYFEIIQTIWNLSLAGLFITCLWRIIRGGDLSRNIVLHLHSMQPLEVGPNFRRRDEGGSEFFLLFLPFEILFSSFLQARLAVKQIMTNNR